MIYLDEHDVAIQSRLRPDCLVMKGEAKATVSDMMLHADDLTKKFHKHVYNSILAVITSNELIVLYSITYFKGRFFQQVLKQYVVQSKCSAGCIDFIVDIFNTIIWILSQTEPIKGSHLVPDVRIKPPNRMVTILP
jgi:hypothetical protein